MSDDSLSPEEHHQRGRDDAQTSNRFGHTAAQSAILVNGGAATALLAFLSSVIREQPGTATTAPFFRVLIPVVLVALFFYGIGVFFAALSLPHASKSIENYMMGHDRFPKPNSTDLWDEAGRQWNRFILLVKLSLWLFAVSTTILTIGLLVGAVSGR